MNIQAFSGPSRTLTGTSTEHSNIERPSYLGKWLTRKKKLNNTLEEIINIDKDLEVYTNHQLSLSNPQVLYKTNVLNFNTQLLRINREEEILVSLNLALISRESSRKIK